ncbi:hypothetical protein [Legionella maioricensis]|uniref:Uncharacterized protein n=1 Tax=Legionella maioricensis TaxID=2896528 RepID=A0A9X2IAY0_9GAMM|nr:hypothetical protein [Legionella maioricensis]MCL9683751.1 hypothetical protein [Legionella maioricensis]MCL9687525.1 hypothetical protein [Legionella maioricensis]
MKFSDILNLNNKKVIKETINLIILLSQQSDTAKLLPKEYEVEITKLLSPTPKRTLPVLGAEYELRKNWQNLAPVLSVEHLLELQQAVQHHLDLLKQENIEKDLEDYTKLTPLTVTWLNSKNSSLVDQFNVTEYRYNKWNLTLAKEERLRRENQFKRQFDIEVKSKGLERFKTAQAIETEFNARKKNDPHLNELNARIQDLESKIEIEKRYRKISTFIDLLKYVGLNLTSNIQMLAEYCDDLHRDQEEEVFNMEDIPGSVFTFL